jgi:chromate transporter
MSDSPPPSTTRPSLAGLFLGFFTVGLYGFGGVLPWARRMVVEQRRWMSATEFTDLLGLCQFLPGGNIMNVTIALGARFHGVPGSISAFLGLMSAPVAIVIGLGVIYDRYANLPPVRHGFAALAAAAAALVLANALKIAAPLRTQPLGIGIAAVTFAVVVVLRLPLLWALPVLAGASTVLLWRFSR